MIIKSIIYNDSPISFSLLFIGGYRIGKLGYFKHIDEMFYDNDMYKKAKDTESL